MTDRVQLTIDFSQSDLDPDRLDSLTQALWKEFQDEEGIQVDRIPDPNPPDGNRAGGAPLPGWLKADVTPAMLLTPVKYLVDRLGRQPIKIKGKRGDREVEIEVRGQQDLLIAKQALEDLLQL